MRYVTASEMRKIDRAAAEEYGIPPILLMENAGRSVAEEASRLLKQKKGAKISIVCGKGNNGGDGLCAARHLDNIGFEVRVWLIGNTFNLSHDAAANYKIITKMGIPIAFVESKESTGALCREIKRSDLLIDAIFGTGLSRNVEEPYRSVINAINESKKPVLAVDIPSGLNADSGKVLGTCVKANVTVTLGLPKRAFRDKKTHAWTGEIVVADISIPRILTQQYFNGRGGKKKRNA